MSIYAVIDTNVLVSALLKRNSNPGNVVLNVLAGIVKPVYSQAILAEYKEVLSRKKFSFSKQTIHSVIQKITKNGIELSGRRRDFPTKPFVVTPEEMLQILEKKRKKDW